MSDDLLQDVLIELDRLWAALESVYGKQDTGNHFELRNRIVAAQQREPTIIKKFPMQNAYPEGHKPKRNR